MATTPNVSNRNNIGSPVPQGLIARVGAGVRATIRGVTDAWFGPLQPLPPMAQQQAEGRQLDFPIGVNLQQTPRANEPVTFVQMRSLADSYDLMRLVIESRKDQISKLSWQIKPKHDESKGGGSQAQPDSRCADLTQFFTMPDGEHTWNVWLRALIEDMLVVDAATLYPRVSNGGEVLSLDLMDGTMFKRLLSNEGRTPVPPDPAYQQVLKGLPAVDYSRDELIYAVRNVRTSRVYGYSPVEQVIMTVNIALRRQLSQLEYYTHGSTPDLLLGVPEDWQPDQIRQFQEWWDSILAGNTQSRRGSRFIPGGINPINTKDALLKDDYDDWLARIICYAFSISPHAFIKAANRATSQQAGKESHEEGQFPLMVWVKDLINLIIVKYFGYADIEFVWKDDQTVDPLAQAQIDQIYIVAKVKTPNEVRDTLGMAALTPEQEAALTPPPPEPTGPPGSPTKPITGVPPTKGAPGLASKLDDEGTYLGKKARAVVAGRAKAVPIDRSRKLVAAMTPKVAACIKAYLARSKTAHTKRALELLAGHREQPTGTMKADALSPEQQRLLEQVLAQLNTDEVEQLASELSAMLGNIAEDAALEALTQIGLDGAADVIVNLVNEQAVQWALDRGAEMVGMKWIGNELVPNPDAEWAITDAQREDVAYLTVQAMEEGWSNDKLATEIGNAAGFSDSRAEMIARTETAMADVNGNMVAYRASGIVHQKEWIVGEEACPECQENADIGAVGLDETFPSGDDVPPAHPNCRCDILPIVLEIHDDSTGDDAEQP